METLRNVSNTFLIEKENGRITKIWLSLKKEGFGKNRFNGTGGKFDPEAGDKTVEDTAIREAQDEFRVTIERKNLIKAGEISFYFPHKPEYNQHMHIFLVEVWEGEPSESKEMQQPELFLKSEIPYSSMWSSDLHWLPQVLAGNVVGGTLVFKEHDMVNIHNIQIVASLKP